MSAAGESNIEKLFQAWQSSPNGGFTQTKRQREEDAAEKEEGEGPQGSNSRKLRKKDESSSSSNHSLLFAQAAAALEKKGNDDDDDEKKKAKETVPQFATFASFREAGGDTGQQQRQQQQSPTSVRGKLTYLRFPNFVNNRMLPLFCIFQLDGKTWFKGKLPIVTRDLVHYTIVTGKQDMKSRGDTSFYIGRIEKIEPVLPVTKAVADDLIGRMLERQRFPEHTNEGRLARHLAESALLSAVHQHFQSEQQQGRGGSPRPFQLVPCLVKESKKTDIPAGVANWAKEILDGVNNADYLIALRYPALLQWFPLGELCKLEWNDRRYMHDEVLMRTPMDVFFWPNRPSMLLDGKQKQQSKPLDGSADKASDSKQQPEATSRRIARVLSRVSLPDMMDLHHSCFSIMDKLLIKEAKMNEQDFCNAWFYHIFESDQLPSGDTAVQVFDYDPQKRKLRMHFYNANHKSRKKDRERIQSLYDRLYGARPSKGEDLERQHADVALRLIEKLRCIEVRSFFDPWLQMQTTYAASASVFGACDHFKRFILGLEQRRKPPTAVKPRLKPADVPFEADEGQKSVIDYIFSSGSNIKPLVALTGRAGTGKTETLKFFECKREERADPEEVKKRKKQREKIQKQEAKKKNGGSGLAAMHLDADEQPVDEAAMMDDKWKTRADLFLTAPTNAIITTRIRRQLMLSGENFDYLNEYCFYNPEPAKDRFKDVEIFGMEEMSMVEEKKFLMMAPVMEQCMPKLSTPLLIGDPRQLASVGGGAVLRDISDWNKHRQLITLKVNHRVGPQDEILNRVNDAVLNNLVDKKLPLGESSQFVVRPFAGQATIEEIFEEAHGQPGMINCHIIALRHETCDAINLAIMKLCKFVPDFVQSLPTEVFVGQKVIVKDNVTIDDIRLCKNQLLWIDAIYDETKANGERQEHTSTSAPMRFHRRSDGARKLAMTKLPLRDHKRNSSGSSDSNSDQQSNKPNPDADTFVVTWSDDLRYSLAPANCSTCNAVQGLQAKKIFAIIEPDVAENAWIYTAFSRAREYLRVYVCPKRVWDEEQQRSRAQDFAAIQPLSQEQAVKTLEDRIKTQWRPRVTALSCVLMQE